MRLRLSNSLSGSNKINRLLVILQILLEISTNNKKLRLTSTHHSGKCLKSQPNRKLNKLMTINLR